MPTSGESIVALEHLDSHIKAILKLKLRAFVHLNPCFDSIHSIDIATRMGNTSSTSPVTGKPSGSLQHFVAAPPPRTAIPMFPPIPEKDLSKSSEDEKFAEFLPEMPETFDFSAPVTDCPNRLVQARMRRHARV